MNHHRTFPLLTALFTLGLATTALAQYPQPSPYPISWELGFEHGVPRRVVVQADGKPQAFWYLTYTVTNSTDQARSFLPRFEMMTREGQLIRGDQGIPPAVFQAIKAREGNPLLEPFSIVAGDLLVGPEQARDGVVIWKEPTPRMGTFQIFVEGLSGEAATVKGPGDAPVILRKTLQLSYTVRGDGIYPAEEQLVVNPSQWVMR